MTEAKSNRAFRISPFRGRPTKAGAPLRALFKGVKKALAAGRIRAACCNLPAIERNRLSGTRLFFKGWLSPPSVLRALLDWAVVGLYGRFRSANNLVSP